MTPESKKRQRERVHSKYSALPSRHLCICCKTDDLPSWFKASVFKKTGGFDESFLTGEDTKVCMDIVYRQGKKLVYAPDVVVYHHRRPLFKPHLKQVRTYSRHRGLFARIFPKTSRRLTYFIPSTLVTGLVVGLLLSFIPFVKFLLIIGYGTLIGGPRTRRSTFQIYRKPRRN